MPTKFLKSCAHNIFKKKTFSVGQTEIAVTTAMDALMAHPTGFMNGT